MEKMTKEQLQWREALEQSKAFPKRNHPETKENLELLTTWFHQLFQENTLNFQIYLGEGSTITIQDLANLPRAVGSDDKIPVSKEKNVSSKPKPQGAKDTNRVRHYRPMP